MDTGAWYASEVEDDVNHRAARGFISQVSTGKRGVPVATDYVLDETMTLMRSKRGLTVAKSFIGKIRSSSSVRVFWVDGSLFEKGSIYFASPRGSPGVSRTAQVPP